MKVLAQVLSHEVLASEYPAELLRQREGILEGIWRSADIMRRDRRKQLEQRLRQIAKETAALADEQRQCEHELGGTGPHERTEIRDLFQRSGWPLVPTGEFGYALPESSEAARPVLRHWRKPKGPEWTEDDFRKNATPYQQRIFAVFVRLGRRSLGIKQLAEQVGLSAQTVATALAGFTRLAARWGRQPLFEVQKGSAHERARLGRVYTIVQRHWPTLQRLYRPPAPRKQAKMPSTG